MTVALKSCYQMIIAICHLHYNLEEELENVVRYWKKEMRIVSWRTGLLIPLKCALLFVWSHLLQLLAPQCLTLGMWAWVFARMAIYQDTDAFCKGIQVQTLCQDCSPCSCPLLCCFSCHSGFISALLSAWNTVITFQSQFYMFLLLNHYFPAIVKHLVYHQSLTFIILITKN